MMIEIIHFPDWPSPFSAHHKKVYFVIRMWCLTGPSNDSPNRIISCLNQETFPWLGDILSQRQNVPLHYAPPRRHNVPTYAPSPATFCPTFSIWIPTPRAKLARISGISGIYLGQFLAISLAYIWENHCSTCIFRATNCPIWQNVPLSPRRQNVPTYALMHRKVMESCWDILSVVPLY